MVKTDNIQKPSPERTSKQSTNTMTRKIERHQENLLSKNKQQQESSSIPSNINIYDGWQEVIGKQKKFSFINFSIL
jgi:hypothetical protein